MLPLATPKSLHIPIIFLVGVGLPATGYVLSIWYFQNWRLEHEQLHAVIESIGGFASIAIVILLFAYDRFTDTHDPKIGWITSAFLAMGLTEIAHASVPIGENFVWFLRVAEFLGGCLLALVWLPERYNAISRVLPTGILIGAIAVTGVSITIPEAIPSLVNGNNITLVAGFLNILGGLGFLAACAYFLKTYIHLNRPIDSWLTSLCLLFAAAGFSIEHSNLWEAGWWWWHLLRLSAYIVFAACLFTMLTELSKKAIASRDEARISQAMLKQSTIELRSKHIELSEKTRLAEMANYAKSRFLATMSHEIRTPLNGIVGVSELLLATELSEKQKRYATTLNRSSDVLLSIIGDVLDFSKIEAGEMNLNPMPVDLYKLMKEMMDAIGTDAEEQKIELVFRYDKNIPESILLDPVRLRQLIFNLAGNAIKFTHDGLVLVDIRIAETSQDENIRLRFTVQDNGIGISEEKQAEIFESFSQADTSTTRKHGGTGLGLAICRKLVSLMGGVMDVDSELGQGSTFWFEIPTKSLSGSEEVGDKSLRSEKALAELRRQRVLIVDDISTNCQVLEAYLKSWSVTCHSVSSGKDAIIEIIRAEEEGNPYTLGLIDYVMPQMSGEQLAAALNKRPKSRDISLILITAAHKIKDDQVAETMGFKSCILKPIYPSELMDTILEVLNFNTGSPTANSENPTAPASPSSASHIHHLRPKILVAEDCAVNQMFAEEILEELQCDVEIAENGKLAFDRFISNPYDLILMDCMMPEMDGYEATQAIRVYENGNSGKGIPIVAMTANAMEGDRERCIDAGMSDYITKPARREDIRQVLSKFIPIGQ